MKIKREISLLRDNGDNNDSISIFHFREESWASVCGRLYFRHTLYCHVVR